MNKRAKIECCFLLELETVSMARVDGSPTLISIWTDSLATVVVTLHGLRNGN